MALSTIGRNQLNTGIDDNSDATAITIDTNENVGLASRISVGTTTVPSGNTRAVITGGGDNYLQMVSNAGNGGISIGNHAGGIMLFYSHTGALGSETFTQNMRLDTDGLKFGTDSAAANALDDYEEGTVDWYTLTDGTATWTQSNANNRYASYTKIGNQVHVHGNIFNGSISGSQAGPVRVPLPYTNANTSSGQNRAVGIAAVYNGSSAYTGDYTLLKVEAGASYGEIVSGGNNGQWGTVTLPTNGTIIIDIFYTAA